jgi:hypothetical protein
MHSIPQQNLSSLEVSKWATQAIDWIEEHDGNQWRHFCADIDWLLRNNRKDSPCHGRDKLAPERISPG